MLLSVNFISWWGDSWFGAQSLPALSTWVASGMERIDKTSRPGNSINMSLSAARGEYEAFQIGIRASQNDLTNVNVVVSDFVGSNNQIISNKNISLYREHYVYVNYESPDLGGTNRPLGKGWYADGLIPFNDPVTGQDLVGAALDAAPFRVTSGENQPVWVDVFIPRDAAAGQYRATFTVTSDQGSSSGQIMLQVWDFELPLQPTLSSAFLFEESQTKEASIELLKHKLNPQFNTNPDPTLERELIDQWGLKSSAMRGFWSGAELGSCEMAPAPSVRRLKAEAALHQSDLFKYVYSADEIDGCPNLYETMRQWGQAIHQAGLSNLVVMAPVPELYDDASGTGRSAVDVWVVLPKMYEKSGDRIAEVLRKGDQVWSYNSLVQDSYSPKWQIDFAPMNFRIQPGFMSQSLGLTGLLYWQVDRWTSDPWNDIHTFFDPFDNYRPYPGDGMLVYPGGSVGVNGVVPSMRLKWLREGVEDYEYIAILQRLGQGDRALELSRSLARDWANWTQDPYRLAEVRQQLGAEIERIQRLQATPILSN
ncbi:MAG: glycoside hydrolase domain-containing protein [Synechococcales bacterium]|nr:glycoside hydrolase domain-containing protein [Synechococcales bacterium]